VDETLWQGINRVKNPAEESELEKLHSPVMKVPAEGIFILDQSRAGLEKAPGFDKADWPDWRPRVALRHQRLLSATCALQSGLCGSVGTRAARQTEWRSNRKDLKRDTRLMAK
jgi:hypothetical protein